MGVIIGGDFNTILEDGERSNKAGQGGIDDPICRQFVDEACLVDLPLQKAKFTWLSAKNGGLWSRLDRWLVSKDILLAYNNIT